MSNQIIRAAFAARLASWASSSGVTVVGENEAYAGPVDSTYVRVALRPKESRNNTLCGAEHQGAWRMEVVAPVGSGITAADAIVDGLLALFPSGLNMDGVRVIAPPRVRRGHVERTPGYYRVPVSVRYLVA
ncbi:phage tail terminator-like protein [Bordetella sp. LUAb4]|uniref:phage tail terminator-like protein n=1 Tax=Bordetella sp. LUAb4 TaxID=2843195 RepID=UPI001E47ECFC